MTGRIEWSRYNGEDIENVVAMFVISDFPFTAEHITPSRGDGGIDILVRHDDKVRVYQVKRFWRPLESGQKSQVKESVDRLVNDPRVQHLQVDAYHLVTPWEPTLEAKEWLTEYVTSKNLPAPVWHGEQRLDTWAGKYPYVVDYYLNGQRETIAEAARGLISGLRLRQLGHSTPEDLTPAQLAISFEEVVAYLNQRDPFYSYSITVEPRTDRAAPTLEGIMPTIRPGTVLVQEMRQADTVLRVEVYAKTRMSTKLCPLTVEATLKARPGSVEEQDLRSFVKFGSPFQLPEGSMDGVVDAPGGLGRQVKGAAVRFTPLGAESEDDERRLMIFDPNGNEIVALDMQRQYFTFGHPKNGVPPGVETRLRDQATQTLSVIFRYDNETQEGSMSVAMDLPAGQAAAKVVAPLLAFSSLTSPNSFTLAHRYGPIPSVRTPLPPRESESGARFWYELAKSLTLIQEHTTKRLHFPERLEDMEVEALQDILTTGALLNGQVVRERMSQALMEHSEGPPHGECEIHCPSDWFVDVPEGRVQVGQVVRSFQGSISERGRKSEHGLLDVWNVAGGVVLTRLTRPGEIEGWESAAG